MEIRIESLLTGAKKAEGVVVIIDVYRAFTTAAYALGRGAERLILTAEIDEAYMLRRRKEGHFCVGEVDGKKPEDFDFGNSPFEIGQAEIQGKTLVLSTRAGTVGANAAWHAERIYGAALTHARATAEVIRAQEPSLVTLVPMGHNGRIRADEDELCALYLKNLLLGLEPPAQALPDILHQCHEAAKFADPDQPHFHPEDLEMALDMNRFPFAIRIVRRDRLLTATTEFPPHHQETSDERQGPSQ